MSRPSIFGLLEALESTSVTVHQDRCAVVRNRNASCMRCADACTSGCISYGDNKLTIAPERCVGCGTCATVCPTCALEAHHPSDAELYATCHAALEAADGLVTIACEQLTQAASGRFDVRKVVGVTCLGRVEESLVTRLAADGAREIVLTRGACATCEHAVGERTAQRVCENTNTLLEAWGSSAWVRLSDKLPAAVRLTEKTAFDADRRAFLSGVAGEAKVVAATSADLAVRDALGMDAPIKPSEQRYVRVMADGTLPHFIPDRRERLLDALAELGEPADVDLTTRLWGHVSIDAELCSSCQMCATFCPTGAIVKFQDTDGTFGVEHRPSDCVQCRCCTDICPEGALSVSDVVRARDVDAGTVERFVMVPRDKQPSGPHSMLNYMKDLMDTDQIYER